MERTPSLSELNEIIFSQVPLLSENNVGLVSNYVTRSFFSLSNLVVVRFSYSTSCL